MSAETGLLYQTPEGKAIGVIILLDFGCSAEAAVLFTSLKLGTLGTS